MSRFLSLDVGLCGVDCDVLLSVIMNTFLEGHGDRHVLFNCRGDLTERLLDKQDVWPICNVLYAHTRRA